MEKNLARSVSISFDQILENHALDALSGMVELYVSWLIDIPRDTNLKESKVGTRAFVIYNLYNDVTRSI